MPQSISFAELLSRDWPDDVFIDGGILSRAEKLLLGAESKAGKSTLLQDFIRAISTGTPLLGFKVTRPLKVLYLQAELKECRIKERLLPTFQTLDPVHLANAHIWSTKGRILLERDMKLIRQELDALRPDVSIFDPSLNFHCGDENSSQQMAVFFRHLDALMDDYSMATVVAQHFRKQPDQSNGKKVTVSLLEMIRGSSAFRQWPDTIICMEGRTETEFRKLQFETRNADEPIHRYIRYNKTTKSFDWYNPLEIISAWSHAYIEAEAAADRPVTSTTFIKAMLAEHGVLLSHNKSKAQEMKRALTQTNQICERPDGKFIFITNFDAVASEV